MMFTVYLKSVVVNFIYLFLNFSLMGFSCSLRALCCGVWALWVESSASRAGLISYCMGLAGYSMQNLNSPTRDQTCVPCIGKQILNHWTTGEVPMNFKVTTKRMVVCIFLGKCRCRVGRELNTVRFGIFAK